MMDFVVDRCMEDMFVKGHMPRGVQRMFLIFFPCLYQDLMEIGYGGRYSRWDGWEMIG